MLFMGAGDFNASFGNMQDWKIIWVKAGEIK
jgi:hypothetical protein